MGTLAMRHSSAMGDAVPAQDGAARAPAAPETPNPPAPTLENDDGSVLTRIQREMRTLLREYLDGLRRVDEASTGDAEGASGAINAEVRAFLPRGRGSVLTKWGTGAGAGRQTAQSLRGAGSPYGADSWTEPVGTVRGGSLFAGDGPTHVWWLSHGGWQGASCAHCRVAAPGRRGHERVTRCRRASG